MGKKPLVPTLDANDVRRALKVLNSLEENATKDLRSELRAKLSPIAQEVAEAVPKEPPLSGFAGSAPTSWSPVRKSVSFTPGRSRKTGNRLVALRITPSRRGVYIAELAGSRSKGYTASGRSMINVLNQRQKMKGAGGRYIYNKFRQLRPDVVKLTEGILNDTFKKAEKKL